MIILQRPPLYKTLYLSIILLFLLAFSARATHLRAGEITVTRDACNSLKFWITITVFTDTGGPVLFGSDGILDFGDGSDPDNDGTPGISLEPIENKPRPDLGENMGTASYKTHHTYSGNSTYTISYTEPNRNSEVVNISNPDQTKFYIESQIIADPFFGCNENTPTLAVPPIDRGCTGVAWFHNPGAFDLDGDSLSYEMVIPFRERETTVVNYRDPNNPQFYTNYNAANELSTGPPTFNINPVTGTITWDAPGSAGEYNIAFVIREWRNLDGTWKNMGFVRRDMQIIIEDCDNERPDLIVPEDVCVEAGTTLDATIFGIDPDNDNVKIEAYSEIFNFASAAATYTPDPAIFQPSVPPAQLKFQWKTQCEHVKDQPYQVVFKITDNPNPGVNLVTFKTWNIRVVGPAPEWVSATPDFGNRYATLQWEDYFCENAETMQVWRRVDSLAFEPDSCQTGMPDNLGYTLIRELPMQNGNTPVTSFTDTNNGIGLSVGAVYCYRLVAVFPDPRGGESYVSKEICIPPILATAPVITHVTVDRTGETNGQITVRWVEPFDVDPAQFPPPYSYEVYRAEGFAGNANITRVPSSDPNALEVVDTGLDTEDRVYNYRVVARDAGAKIIDTSSVASAVRLEAQSQLNAIELTWNANVPWSNQLAGFPHRIYRGEDGATTPEQLTLITEVNVLTSGFTYIDEGQHNGTPLEPGRTYCYYVETIGAYGSENPILRDKEPFRNFSQIICAQRGDTIPPCKPQPPLAHEPLNCEDYVSKAETCNNNLLINNTLKWTRPTEEECGTDISYYRIYIATTSDGDFVPLLDRSGNFVQARDTFFVHRDLPSFAGCYKISAVDRSGNESELSDAICFDNCPYYELPNVFTPNNDDCNDIFSAYSERDMVGENHVGPCGNPSDEVKGRCARFVNDVVFRVYNRWGKEVYAYESGGERTIYIDWDGRASDGSDLSSGVYYYIAEVNFNTADPAKRNQVIKGWVNLIRGAPISVSGE